MTDITLFEADTGPFEHQKNDEKMAEIGKYFNSIFLTWRFCTNSEFCIWFQAVKNWPQNTCFCRQLYGVNNTSFGTVFMWRTILRKLQHFSKIFISIFSTKEALWFSKPKFVRIRYASQFITFKILNFLTSKIHPKTLRELFQFLHNYTLHKK